MNTIPDYFIRAILEAPDDDSPRLMLADWLDENGQGDRAAFIKLQIQAANMKPWCPANPEKIGNDCPCTWHTLKRRERDALKACWTSDFRGLFSPVEVYGIEVSTCRMKWKGIDAIPTRGFISAITCTMSDFLSHGPAIVASQPIERVDISDKRPLPLEEASGPDRNDVYWWQAGMFPEDESNLPIEISSAMHDMTGIGFSYQSFPTESAAREALSKACLQWARSKKAGPRLAVTGRGRNATMAINGVDMRFEDLEITSS